MTLSDADQLDSQGAWQGALPRAERELDFPMAFEDGEWRIDKAPDALIVPETWFEQRFRQVSLFFFDPTASTLVPEPVFVPRGVQLASALTRALLLGPGAGLGSVIQSFVPAGMTLNLSVPISADGVAEIGLKGDAGQLSHPGDPADDGAAGVDAAPGAAGDRAAGHHQRTAGAAARRGRAPTASTAAPSTTRPASRRARSSWACATGCSSRAPAAPSGRPAARSAPRQYGVRSVAMDLTATTAAAVTADGRSVLEAPVSDGRRGRTHDRLLRRRRDLLPPAWDLADRLWLVDRTSQGAEVSYVGPHGSGTLEVPGISGERVRSSWSPATAPAWWQWCGARAATRWS